MLRYLSFADAYIDDVIVGSNGDILDDAIAQHKNDLVQVLETLEAADIVVSTKKMQLFLKEVEFCSHILSEWKRRPAPWKLLALQKLELPRVVTQFRGFLGLAIYFSEYVPKYAEIAGSLFSKLQLNKHDGRKGSQKVLKWDKSEMDAFENLKKAMVEKLELIQIQVDQLFVMECDASTLATGAVLKQMIDVELRPVACYSRKLTPSQRKWTPEKKKPTQLLVL